MGKVVTKEGTMKLAQARVRKLVKQGYRLDPGTASKWYHESVASTSPSRSERNESSKIVDKRNRGGG